MGYYTNESAELPCVGKRLASGISMDWSLWARQATRWRWFRTDWKSATVGKRITPISTDRNLTLKSAIRFSYWYCQAKEHCDLGRRTNWYVATSDLLRFLAKFRMWLIGSRYRERCLGYTMCFIFRCSKGTLQIHHLCFLCRATSGDHWYERTHVRQILFTRWKYSGSTIM